ncbi:LANO_0A01596g1_1 [Lachancea nothofagi CBS 11611]|uniref:peptidylprolyl isomerase n=1 Tax=Lachancea nothofagi CBS 11611 TaxID=1266666 RepID=A0A1G4IMT2_9SACH|nr:LANO_0A01596g1_1 [Lachancea nothofagi CBS 11611]
MLTKYLLWTVYAVIGLVNAAQITNGKTYEPNPPVTHRVFFTIEYTDKDTEKLQELDITMELYGTVVPRTVDNFAKIAKGVTAVMRGKDEKTERFTLGYQDSLFHRVVPNFIIQGGDILPGVSSFNIYGGLHFEDENFTLKHDRPGRMSMANLDKPDTNASQFFIVTSSDPQTHLDGKHVVFGQVVAGLDELMQKVQFVEVDGDYKPLKDILLKYALVEELQITTKEELHQDWLVRLQKYQNGDVTQGTTMDFTLAQGQKEEAIMRDEKYAQLHHPAVKVALGFAILLVIYLLVRNRARIFGRSAKIVSMRHD